MGDNNSSDKEYEKAVQHVESQKALMLPEAQRRQGISEEISDTLTRLQRTPSDNLEDVLKRASTLPDGTAVFMSRAFVVFDVNRQEVAAHLLGSVQWKDGAPTFEDFMIADAETTRAKARSARSRHKTKLASYEVYLKLLRRADNLEAMLVQLKRHKADVLSYVRRRLTDADNPPSVEEMELFTSILEDEKLKSALSHDPQKGR